MQRAKETASYISEKTNKEIVLSDLFVERIKPSEINGKLWTDVKANNIWRKWEETLYTPGQRTSDGENYDDTIARADRALAFLEKPPELTLAVVTHGYFLRAIVARVLLRDNLTRPIMKRFQERASIDNTTITVLNYRDAFEETLQRHSTELNAHEFGEKEMRKWYKPNQLTGFASENVIPELFSVEEAVKKIETLSI